MTIKPHMLKSPLPLPYFDNLPRVLMPALQAAYDKAKSGSFGLKAIHASFTKDVQESGHEPPAVPVMNQWVAGVQAGRIRRPGSAPAEKREAEATFEPLAARDFAPSTMIEERLEAQAFSFEDLYERLVDEKVDELTKGVREEARRQVAEQLRQRLAELA